MNKYVCVCCGKCYTLDWDGEEIYLPPEDCEVDYQDYNDRDCEVCENTNRPVYGIYEDD